MGAGRLETIVDLLMANGRAPETPVAAVRWGTRAEQSTTRATLATITALGVASPSAIVVGPVAGLDLAWFEARPLFGRRIVVTRAREQASALRTRLEELGAEVIELPTIAIEPLPVDRARPRRAHVARVHLGERRRRLLRPRPRRARPRRPGARRACGSPRSDPGPPPRSRRSASAPDLVPGALRRRVAARGVPARADRRAGRARPGRAGARRAARGSRAARVRASTCCPCTGPSPRRRTPSDLDARPGRRGRRDHVHVVVDGHELLRPRRRPCRRPRPRSCRSVRSPATRPAPRGLAVDAEADPHTIDGLVAALLATLAPPVLLDDLDDLPDLDR